MHSIFIIDYDLAVMGINTILGDLKPFAHCCGSTDSLDTAYDKLGKMQTLPSLVIMDIKVGMLIKFENIKQLKKMFPKLLIAILTAEDSKHLGLHCIKAGAAGFISKRDSVNRITEKLQSVLQGNIVITTEMANHLAKYLHNTGNHNGDPLDSLSDREMEVMLALGQGLSTREVATHLGVSIKTIEAHRAHIKEKMSFADGNELTQYAISLNQYGQP